jgi:hypothetical protein
VRSRRVGNTTMNSRIIGIGIPVIVAAELAMVPAFYKSVAPLEWISASIAGYLLSAVALGLYNCPTQNRAGCIRGRVFWGLFDLLLAPAKDFDSARGLGMLPISIVVGAGVMLMAGDPYIGAAAGIAAASGVYYSFVSKPGVTS